MRLSDEDKRSILEESSDARFQEELKLLSAKIRRLTVEEYLDFLGTVSRFAPHPVRRQDLIVYHKVIF